MFRLNSNLTLEQVLTVPHADGGGIDIALGAMLAGASAIDAIKITGMRTSWSNREVDSVVI